jgi:hypothetical protein
MVRGKHWRLTVFAGGLTRACAQPRGIDSPIDSFVSPDDDYSAGRNRSSAALSALGMMGQNFATAGCRFAPYQSPPSTDIGRAYLRAIRASRGTINARRGADRLEGASRVLEKSTIGPVPHRQVLVARQGTARARGGQHLASCSQALGVVWSCTPSHQEGRP